MTAIRTKMFVEDWVEVGFVVKDKKYTMLYDSKFDDIVDVGLNRLVINKSKFSCSARYTVGAQKYKQRSVYQVILDHLFPNVEISWVGYKNGNSLDYRLRNLLVGVDQELEPGQIWNLKKSGDEYLVEALCSIKHVTGEWVPGIRYRKMNPKDPEGTGDNQEFIRYKTNFLKNFKPLLSL